MNNNWLLRCFIVMNFLLISSVNNAQTVPTELIEDVLEELSVNNDEEQEHDWSNELEELSERIQQPLNSATN